MAGPAIPVTDGGDDQGEVPGGGDFAQEVVGIDLGLPIEGGEVLAAGYQVGFPSYEETRRWLMLPIQDIITPVLLGNTPSRRLLQF
jgi:hypothetical protein